MTDSTDDVKQTLADQAKTIDALHHRLAAVPGIAKEQLKTAVDRYKKAHETFSEDALECMH